MVVQVTPAGHGGPFLWTLGRRHGADHAGEGQYDTVRAVLLAAVAALGGFLFGFDTAVINGTVNAIREEFGMGAGLTGFAVASALLGCALGAWLAGQLADRQGRIRVMLLASLLFTVSAIGSGLAQTPWDLILWRVVGGLGVGAAWVIAPAYIAEISPASIRGRLGSLQQLAIVTRHLRRTAVRLLPRDRGRRRSGGAVARARGLALDVHERGRP